MTLGCQYKGIRKSEFVAKTQSLCITNNIRKVAKKEYSKNSETKLKFSFKLLSYLFENSLFAVLNND